MPAAEPELCAGAAAGGARNGFLVDNLACARAQPVNLPVSYVRVVDCSTGPGCAGQAATMSRCDTSSTVEYCPFALCLSSVPLVVQQKRLLVIMIMILNHASYSRLQKQNAIIIKYCFYLYWEIYEN